MCLHCVKSVQIWSYFWFVFSCIRTRNNFLFGCFSRSANCPRKYLPVQGQHQKHYKKVWNTLKVNSVFIVNIDHPFSCETCISLIFQSAINGNKLSREDFLNKQSYQYRFYKLLSTSFKYIHYSKSVISVINIRVTQLCNAIQHSCRKLLNVNLWNCNMTADVRV